MPAGVYDIYIEQGADFLLEITLQNNDGTAVDLTGYTGSGQIRKTAGDGTVLANLLVTFTDRSAGKFTVSLTASATSAITANGHFYKTVDTYAYDIELTDSEGKVSRIMNGYVKFSPEVTR